MSKEANNTTKSKARAAEVVQPARKRQAAAHQVAASTAAAWPVQTSLQVGMPGDRFEQEANQQADAFSRGGQGPGIQRMATEELQGSGAESGTVSSDFESSLSNSDGGQPLPDSTRSSMEGHFGADFSGVRVHNDSQSASMNQSLGAKAFTHGSDVYFNEGEYNPGTSSGDHLIAHELTHTVQQGAAIQTSPQIQKAEQDPEPEPEPEAPAPAPAQNQPAAAGAAAPPPSGGGNGAAAAGGDSGAAATGPPPPEQVATDPAQTAPRSAEPQNTNPPPIPADDQKPVEEDPEADAPKKARRSAKISNEVAEVKATDFSSMSSEGAVEAYAASSPSQIAASQKGFGAIIDKKLQGEKKSADEAMPTLVASTEGSLKKDKKGAPEGQEKNAEVKDGVIGPNPPEATLPEHKEGGALPDYSNLAKDADKAAPKEEGGGFWDWLFKAFKNSMGGISTSDGSVNTSAGARPKVNTTGDGDPQRAQTMRGDGDTKMENERSSTTDLIKSNPGQENIQPQYFSEENPVDLNLSVSQQADMATTDVMEQYVNLPLPAEVRAAADEGLAPLLETTLAEPRKKVADAAVERENTKETEIKKAEAEVERLNTEADQKQQKTVKDSRKLVADEQTRGINEAKKYTDDFNKDANKEQKSASDQITGKIETANKDAKGKLDQAEKDAEKKKKEGEKEAEAAKKKADKDSENDSWWGKFKKAVKSAVSWLTDKIAGIFKAIREAITELINAAKEWALEQIEKARKWVVDKLNKFRDWLKEKVNKYLKDFPALRKKVNKFIDDTVDGAINTVNEVADGLKKAVTALADGLTKAINKALEVFETIITTSLNVAGALVTGDFIGALREGIKGACKVLGIDPQQIFDFMDRAGEMLAGILRDPGGFFTNVGKGISQGFEQFATNIKKHLINGLFDWLTGEMSDVQIQIPTNFDPKGIFYFVAQLLGVTYDQIRAKVVNEIGPNGEQVVTAMETTVELVMDFVQNGPMALWNRAVQYWEKMKEDAKGFLQDMLKWEVVKAGIKFLVKKLAFGPLSAFVAAVELIYDLVTWLMERWESIKAFATSVYDSVAALAAGDTAGAANAIESALARSISPILSLLAGMLNLNGIGKKVQKALDKIREPIHTKIVDPAIKWIVNKGKGLAKAGGNLLANAKDKIAGWLKWSDVEVTFDAPDEKHEVFFEGEKLMMSSEKKEQVEDKIAQVKKWMKETKDIPASDAAKISAAVGEAQSLESTIANLRSKVRGIDPKDMTKEQKSALYKELDDLRLALKNLWTLYINNKIAKSPLTESEISASDANGDSLGELVTATKLTVKPPQDAEFRGSGVGSAVRSTQVWKDLQPAKHERGSTASKYILGHLLNDNLHGPGNNVKNIAPIPRNQNSEHESKTEKLVKDEVFKLGADPAKDHVYYKINADYSGSRSDVSSAIALLKGTSQNKPELDDPAVAAKYGAPDPENKVRKMAFTVLKAEMKVPTKFVMEAELRDKEGKKSGSIGIKKEIEFTDMGGLPWLGIGDEGFETEKDIMKKSFSGSELEAYGLNSTSSIRIAAANSNRSAKPTFHEVMWETYIEPLKDNPNHDFYKYPKDKLITDWKGLQDVKDAEGLTKPKITGLQEGLDINDFAASQTFDPGHRPPDLKEIFDSVIANMADGQFHTFQAFADAVKALNGYDVIANKGDFTKRFFKPLLNDGTLIPEDPSKKSVFVTSKYKVNR